ncbi:bacterial bifunctional deaminase-reductase [Hymenopellis radicata]|nr:bacterial bifunctional deaminase-reductase [Hymenopellis radicata]
MAAPPFLSAVLNKDQDKDAQRPSVTLTFAQSLDAKIAGKNGQQLILSGKESMIMTHWMRTMHDAILVGIGTALNDNPQLNTRHLPHRDPDVQKNGHPFSYHLPRPIILDAQLQLPTTCKLLENYSAGRGRRPWVLTTNSPNVPEDVWSSRIDALQNKGAKVIAIDQVDGLLSIPSLLIRLHELGIKSLMVEGGARVIASFFAHPEVINTIIVTVAPKFVGTQGIGYGLDSSQVSRFTHHSSHIFGLDTVFCLVPSSVQ